MDRVVAIHQIKLQHSTRSRDFTATETIEFTVPADMRSTKVNNEDGLWIRVRLVSGGYGVNQNSNDPNYAGNPGELCFAPASHGRRVSFRLLLGAGAGAIGEGLHL